MINLGGSMTRFPLQRQYHLHTSRHRCSAWRLHAFTITPANGEPIRVDKAKWLIGSGTTVDLRIQQPDVAAEHVELTQKGKQVMCRALVGESVFDNSSTFLDGDELRPNVAYVLASGTQLTLGSQQGTSFNVDFEEGTGGNALLEMMIQGMASGASSDVKQALKDMN